MIRWKRTCRGQIRRGFQERSCVKWPRASMTDSSRRWRLLLQRRPVSTRPTVYVLYSTLVEVDEVASPRMLRRRRLKPASTPHQAKQSGRLTSLAISFSRCRFLAAATCTAREYSVVWTSQSNCIICMVNTTSIDLECKLGQPEAIYLIWTRRESLVLRHRLVLRLRWWMYSSIVPSKPQAPS